MYSTNTQLNNVTRELQEVKVSKPFTQKEVHIKMSCHEWFKMNVRKQIAYQDVQLEESGELPELH